MSLLELLLWGVFIVLGIPVTFVLAGALAELLGLYDPDTDGEAER